MWMFLEKYSKANDCRAFTLMELLVVVLIIGVLASIALPQYKLAVAKARLGTIQSAAATLKEAEEMYYLYTGEYTNDVPKLDIDLPCLNDTVWKNVPICGNWFLDPIDGNPSDASNSVRVAYCPKIAKERGRWTDCEHEADYHLIYWLEHSSYPNLVECRPTPGSALGQRICSSINH